MGGPNTPTPRGGEDEDILNLTPGNYAVICIIPGPNGRSHFLDGMAKALTVEPSSRRLTIPAGDLTLTLTNYAFTFSAPPTSGHHVIRIVNNGTQLHEAVLFHLAPGKKGRDVADWVDTGISPMAPGKENTLQLNLNPGNYALLCFVPDAKDGKLHAMHGMIRDFKII